MSWNEIAGDHFVQLFWEEGTGIGGDFDGPPCDAPEFGGMNAFIERRTMVPRNVYRCKFCREVIGFINKRPYNHKDGTPHRCLAEAHERRMAQRVQQQEG